MKFARLSAALDQEVAQDISNADVKVVEDAQKVWLRRRRTA